MDAETGGRRRILIVDDNAQHRSLLQRILAGCQIISASDGVEALDLLQAEPRPDLILLDVMMPRMDGFEVCRRLKGDGALRDIPVIFMTGLGEGMYEAQGLALGAAGYVSKPFSPALVASRVQAALTASRLKPRAALPLAPLEAAPGRSGRMSLEAIARLCSAAEHLDDATGAHLLRISRYAAAVARRLRLPRPEVEKLVRAAPMHDLGKLGIPGHILLKQGCLDAEEWAIMKQHTWMGARILAGSDSEIARMGEEVALTHHEKWDGSGYPQGLHGSQIPVWGCIVAVVDTFDSLAATRSHGSPGALARCLEVVRRGANCSFDPRVVEAFLAVQDEISDIRLAHPGRLEATRADATNARQLPVLSFLPVVTARPASAPHPGSEDLDGLLCEPGPRRAAALGARHPAACSVQSSSLI